MMDLLTISSIAQRAKVMSPSSLSPLCLSTKVTMHIRLETFTSSNYKRLMSLGNHIGE